MSTTLISPTLLNPIQYPKALLPSIKHLDGRYTVSKLTVREKDSMIIKTIKALAWMTVVTPTMLLAIDGFRAIYVQLRDRVRLHKMHIIEPATGSLRNGNFLGEWWNPLPEKIVNRIQGKSWNSHCPVPLADLAYVQISFIDFQGRHRTGELVYHKNLAQEIVEIFQELYDARYPIERMFLIDDYAANDQKSMADNNSSAFCSRAITNNPGRFSLHSYGGTIDINPFLNPYVKGTSLEPANSQDYLDRTQQLPGMIHEGDACYRAFTSRGYEWGGHWTTLKDYQHFQKEPSAFITNV